MPQIANSMVDWDDNKHKDYVKAERSLISSQVKGWRNRSPWAAWKKMADGELTDYASLLIKENLKGIEELGHKLL